MKLKELLEAEIIKMIPIELEIYKDKKSKKPLSKKIIDRAKGKKDFEKKVKEYFKSKGMTKEDKDFWQDDVYSWVGEDKDGKQHVVSGVVNHADLLEPFIPKAG